jgi:hypothetical protein
MKRAAYGIPVLLVTLLQGCSDLKSMWQDRYGPAPVPTADFAETSSSREAGVVLAFAKYTGVKDITAPDKTPTREDWYKIILTGFNTIDDACMTYIDDLWKFDRNKNRLVQGLSATNAGAQGILSATGHPAPVTLAVLTQSFHMAGTLTSAIADGYLFEKNPAVVSSVVTKTMKKFRTAFEADYKNGINVESIPASYYYMREYLSLCLPPTIQAQIESTVVGAQASSDTDTPQNKPPSSGANTDKRQGSGTNTGTQTNSGTGTGTPTDSGTKTRKKKMSASKIVSPDKNGATLAPSVRLTAPAR